MAERLSHPDFTKRAQAENFPVAGWFIAPRLRGAVQAYYAFARAADDVADSTSLTVIQKLSTLDHLETSLCKGFDGAANGLEVGKIFRAQGIPLTDATDLLTAFRADARNGTVKTLDDLMAYCRHSAAPVGRFLLSLHGETRGEAHADALCASLQILNHVQDARDDIQALKRCYIPTDWLDAEGIALIDLLDPDNLTGSVAGDPIRDDYEHGERTLTTPQPVDPAKVSRCLQRMLDQVDVLLVRARALPGVLKSRGLAAQSAVILCLAQRLLGRLRAHDPWTMRVTLTPADWMVAVGAGLRGLVLKR
ncbi:MAG: squalene/phytoene synthase family protein [Rhodospirillaceae bacterium]|nr:squalene/phytoene synthase family protein [Rhodospirillaceae bacterium]